MEDSLLSKRAEMNLREWVGCSFWAPSPGSCGPENGSGLALFIPLKICQHISFKPAIPLPRSTQASTSTTSGRSRDWLIQGSPSLWCAGFGSFFAEQRMDIWPLVSRPTFPRSTGAAFKSMQQETCCGSCLPSYCDDSPSRQRCKRGLYCVELIIWDACLSWSRVPPCTSPMRVGSAACSIPSQRLQPGAGPASCARWRSCSRPFTPRQLALLPLPRRTFISLIAHTPYEIPVLGGCLAAFITVSRLPGRRGVGARRTGVVGVEPCRL